MPSSTSQCAVALGAARSARSGAVEQRPVAVGERRGASASARAPPPRLPAGVVEVVRLVRPAQVVVGRRSPPAGAGSRSRPGGSSWSSAGYRGRNGPPGGRPVRRAFVPSRSDDGDVGDRAGRPGGATKAAVPPAPPLKDGTPTDELAALRARPMAGPPAPPPPTPEAPPGTTGPAGAATSAALDPRAAGTTHAPAVREPAAPPAPLAPPVPSVTCTLVRSGPS